MDVFGIALAAGGDVLRDAAIDAAYSLEVFAALPASLAEIAATCEVGPRRLRALLDLLVALGVLRRDGERFARGDVPPRPVVAGSGWGLMADVIRRDKPLDVEGGEVELRYHEHLAKVGAAAAKELATTIIARSVLDLGAGVGTYASALLDAYPAARATVVDYHEVVALARRAMSRFGDRVRFVAHDVRGAPLGESHDVVLLANLLHLHPATTCEQLVAIAAGVAAPGGAVVIKDLRVDDGRRGPYEGLAFALNMAIYTGGGDVYETSQLRAWLEAAGLVGIEERRLATQPDGIVMIGFRPRGARATFEAATGIVDPPALAGDDMPPSFRTMLAHAVVELDGDAEPLVAHYTRVMPQMRSEQLAHPIFQTPLDWSRLPRLSAILDRLHALLVDADVPAEMPFTFRARTPTLAAFYERTYYGGFMPLLYGYPADLAYFEKRGRELGEDTHATIDRYLAAPLLHELCHFARDRDALLPPHLDECIAGFIGVHVWPEMAFPEGDRDDAIYAAPWLSQVGQAVARAFGIREVVRAHAGAALWDAVLPKQFIDRVTQFGWDDWCARRSQHFLSDTFDPDPWVDLALGWGPLREDPAFDRAIVRDALRAMCLANTRVDGSFRTRAALPASPIIIDARACRVTTHHRSEVDTVSPRYWLPPAVGARMSARGSERHELLLGSLAELDAAVEDICGPA